jgi:hypothetical protein
LYDLTADPAQQNNLAGKDPARVKVMAARLQSIREQGHSRPE